jgi:predicted ATPase
MDLLRSLVEVLGGSLGTTGSITLAAVTQYLFDERSGDLYPFLGHLLSIPLENHDLEKVQMLDPQALQTQYLVVLRLFFKEVALRNPLILILEDVHWADPSSIELVAKLLPVTFEAPILFCCVTRPDRGSPGWRLVNSMRETVGSGLTEINLESLSAGDGEQLISNLLNLNDFPENIRDRILAKAEGNPLFVEEVIRMLIDQGFIHRSEQGWTLVKEIETIEIPDNIHGLLLARIDRLTEEAKHTLRVASVIGRQFTLEVLEQVLEEHGV